MRPPGVTPAGPDAHGSGRRGARVFGTTRECIEAQLRAGRKGRHAARLSIEPTDGGSLKGMKSAWRRGTVARIQPSMRAGPQVLRGFRNGQDPPRSSVVFVGRRRALIGAAALVLVAAAGC